jgi:four helix bundle protein
MKDNVVKDKSFRFAIRVVNLYKYLTSEKSEFIIARQLLRSGTAVGALVRESVHAESKNDFIHKLAIAQKEANESIYWIELLQATEYLSDEQFTSIIADAKEVISLITAIIKTTKKSLPA